mgnify:CR=1 FL=1
MNNKWNDALNNIRAKAYKTHEDVNQNYGDKPYSFHLHSVEIKTKELLEVLYKGKIEDEEYVAVLFGALFHDSIEDARLSYNDVKDIALEFLSEKYAVMATEIVYALTNEKGRTRAERSNDKYYDGIRNTPYAPLVKLADRMANMEYSNITQSSMWKKYLSEWNHFISSIGFNDLDEIKRGEVKPLLTKWLDNKTKTED